MPLPSTGLTSAEGRVLGCLVEKQLTTPQQYPLTENALLAACNQTTSRDPVVSYDVSTVRVAVRNLRQHELLRTVHRSGERSDKHQHQLETLGLSPAQVTLLAVLLLRGPQTMAELRARAERMHAFGSLEQVEQALEAMAGRAEPLVARMERQPGRKEPRYRQLVAATHDGPSSVVEPPATPPPLAAHAARPPTPAAPGSTVDALAREVAALRDEVAALRTTVDELRRAALDPSEHDASEGTT
jgi:uncharacterized protein YceH (UPF0502 family)